MRQAIYVWMLLGMLPWIASVAAATELQPIQDGVSFRVEDTHTRVGLARVNLKMSKLRWVGDRMVGRYDLAVPIFSSKNESGKFSLAADCRIEEIRIHGGKLEGIGTGNSGSGEEREIKGEIIPDPDDFQRGKIRLTIDTGRRVLKFNTRYHIEG